MLARAAPALGLDLSDLVPAEAAALITVHDSRIEFRHPLVRSAIYGDCLARRRREVHRALAGALPDADVDRRAWHLALASFGPDDAASSALEQAGLRAGQRSAYEVSSRAFERAARLAPEEARQARLLFAAAEAAWLGGLAGRAVALLDEARGHTPAPIWLCGSSSSAVISPPGAGRLPKPSRCSWPPQSSRRQSTSNVPS